jgi:hypothetical protein
MIRIAALGLALTAGVGLAQASELQRTLEGIKACAAITESAQRLACYDGAAPKVRAALDVATEEDQLTLFGLDLFGGSGGAAGSGEATRPEDFGKQDLPATEVVQKGGVISEITVALADIARNGSGYDVYVLENGQVWRQKEPGNLALPKSVSGIKVNIRQGMMGAYYLNRDGSNRSVAVERVK